MKSVESVLDFHSPLIDIGDSCRCLHTTVFDTCDSSGVQVKCYAQYQLTVSRYRGAQQ